MRLLTFLLGFAGLVSSCLGCLGVETGAITGGRFCMLIIRALYTRAFPLFCTSITKEKVGHKS